MIVPTAAESMDVFAKSRIVSGGKWVWLSAGLVVAAVSAAYANSLHGAFVLDDIGCIHENEGINRLWPLWQALWTDLPPGATVRGRPLVNLSLVVNYAISGTDSWSYHVFNIGVHALAALALLGLVRRSLLTPAMGRRFAGSATALAAATAVLWAVHPLTTAAVTYIVQRCESMMGLFFLLTLYCLNRSASRPGGEVAIDPSPLRGEGRVRVSGDAEAPIAHAVWRKHPHPGPGGPDLSLQGRGVYQWPTRLWWAGSAGSCFMGMMCKEVMAVAPVAALLYDRIFLAGSFGGAMRKRWPLYVAFAGCWVALAAVGWGARGDTAGAGSSVSPWAYGATQLWAIGRYLYLTFWPGPLVLDYGRWLAVWPQYLPGAVLVVALASLTAAALWRWKAWGFLGFFFFAVLAPSSSLVPVASQTVGEHRMYLPLAAAVTLTVLLAHHLLRAKLASRRSLAAVAACLLLVATALGIRTGLRNADYSSEIRIWADTVKKRPGNPRGYTALGEAYRYTGNLPKALVLYNLAAELFPDQPRVFLGRAKIQYKLEQKAQAMSDLNRALILDPLLAEAYNDRALCLMEQGRLRDALVDLDRAADLAPTNFLVCKNKVICHYLLNDYPAARKDAERCAALGGHVPDDLLRAIEVGLSGSSSRPKGV